MQGPPNETSPRNTHIDEFVGHAVEGETAPSCQTWQHTRGTKPYLTFFALLADENVLGKTIEQ
jgi:hypothetical protein